MILHSTGKYLLLTNWNKGENGDAAQIISPVVENDGDACLSVYLCLTSTTSGTLSIYQKLLPSMELVLLHEAAYRRSPGWKKIMFTLKNSHYFQVNDNCSLKFAFTEIKDIAKRQTESTPV
jgi:hypothetical protein